MSKTCASNSNVDRVRAPYFRELVAGFTERSLYLQLLCGFNAQYNFFGHVTSWNHFSRYAFPPTSTISNWPPSCRQHRSRRVAFLSMQQLQHTHLGAMSQVVMDLLSSLTNCLFCFPGSPQLKINSRSFKMQHLLGEVSRLSTVGPQQ